MMISKVFRVQILSFFIAGVSQLFALSLCASQLPENDSARFMYLISLTSFLSFLDFGIFWSLYIHLSRRSNSGEQLIRNALKQVTRINAFIGLFFTFGLMLSLVPVDVALIISFILLNNFLFVGLVALRGTKGENIYFLVFNSSWPLALIIYFILSLCGLRFTPALAFVPISASAALNAAASLYVFLVYLPNRAKGKEIDGQDSEESSSLRYFSTYATVVQILTLLSLYGDRFLLFPIMSSNDFLNYSICIQFASIAITIIQNYSSSLVGDQLSGKNILRNYFWNSIPVITVMGFVSAIIYLILMPIVAKVFFPDVAIDIVFLFLVSTNIFLSSISLQIYQTLWISMSLKIRITIQSLGVLSYAFYVIAILRLPIVLWEASLALILFNLGIIPYALWLIIKRARLKN